MKKSVYIETSVISYLTARGSRDLISAARQQLTQEWWSDSRQNVELFVSPLVLKEVSDGDADAAAKRVSILSGIPELELTEEAVALSDVLVAKGGLPEKARDDALHIVVAAVHEIDFLLTWNCRHIDNAATKPIIRAVCLEQGYVCPEICTPEELGGV